MSTKVTKTQIKALAPRDVAAKIVEALAGGILQAAELYREYVDAGGDAMDLRRHACLPASTWAGIDAVARGVYDPRVFVLPVHVQRAVKELPMREQTRLIDDGVELLANDGSGIRVPLHQLTGEQSAMAFGPSGLRSLPEQGAYAKTLRAPAKKPTPMRDGFEALKGKVVIHADCGDVVLTRRDLLNMLQALGD